MDTTLWTDPSGGNTVAIIFTSFVCSNFLNEQDVRHYILPVECCDLQLIIISYVMHINQYKGTYYCHWLLLCQPHTFFSCMVLFRVSLQICQLIVMLCGVRLWGVFPDLNGLNYCVV